MKRQTTLIIAALFMAAALSFGCSDSGTDGVEPPKFAVGAENGACKEDMTCNAGLVCDLQTKFCKKPPAEGELCGPCTAENKCNTGLVCTPIDGICADPGTKIVYCTAPGDCPSGLACYQGLCATECQTTNPATCTPACSAGQECKDNKCVSTGPKAGEEGGACLPESKCSGTLICKASVCSKCTVDADCGSGKVCADGACKACPDGMVFIKGGTFDMGSTTGGSDEKPVHSVTVSDFCMDENEFTNQNNVALKGISTTLVETDPWPTSPTKFDGTTQPLVMVSWTEADAICKKQNKLLPTEAEWEYAARGGIKTEYGTKDGVAPTKDNACWSCENNTCKKTTTCNVGLYSPNVFELYDMSGNVWEWVDADYKPYPESTWASSCPTCKVLRGGSWSYPYPYYLRAAHRHSYGPGSRSNLIGFRCVVAPQDSTE